MFDSLVLSGTIRLTSACHSVVISFSFSYQQHVHVVSSVVSLVISGTIRLIPACHSLVIRLVFWFKVQDSEFWV